MRFLTFVVGPRGVSKAENRKNGDLCRKILSRLGRPKSAFSDVRKTKNRSQDRRMTSQTRSQGLRVGIELLHKIKARLDHRIAGSGARLDHRFPDRMSGKVAGPVDLGFFATNRHFCDFRLSGPLGVPQKRSDFAFFLST